MTTITTTRPSSKDAVSLTETISDALRQAMQMQLVISDLRIHYWITGLMATIVTIACMASVVYGIAWLAMDAPPVAGFDPYAMMLIGAAVLVATLFVAIQRMSTFSILLRTMRRELAHLETKTEEARAEARGIGMASA